MQTLTLNHPKTDPVDDEQNSRAAIRAAGWWERCDVAEHYPLSTDEAVQVLDQAGEYAVDREQILELIDRKILKPPAIEDGALEWHAIDLMAVSGLLEMRGQYRPTPSMNDVKKHPAQILLEQARHASEVSEIVNSPGHPRFDLTHLLALIRHCDNWQGREQLVCKLKAHLEVEHGVFIP